MSLAPASYCEYREPFLGGCGMLLHVRQHAKVWLNDNDCWVVRFWRWLRDIPDAEDRILARQQECQACIVDDDDSAARELFLAAKVRMRQRYDPLDYLTLNLWAVSAMVRRQRNDLCSFSKLWQHDGWTHVHIDKIRQYVRALRGCRITCSDYASMLDAPGQKCFIFLDPPYLLNDHGSPLYSNAWTPDDHRELAERLHACSHRWLLTVSNSRYMRELYKPYRIIRRHYCGSMVHRPKARRDDKTKTELIIRNY